MPVIDESIIPNTTLTYTLGDAEHLYDATYASNVYIGTNFIKDITNNCLAIYRNNTLITKITAGSWPGMVPGGTTRYLGSSTNQWLGTYSTYFYENGTDISDKYATKTELTESLIPNTTLTYTLGDSSHFYNAAYISNIKFTGDGRSSISATNSTTLRLAPNDIGFYLDTNGFRAGSNGNKNLGTSSAQWAYTYSNNFIENGTNIKDIYTQTEIVTQNEYDALTTEQKNSETIYVISDQQAYMNNELVTETSLDSRGFLTADNFQYDPTTGTLTLIL